MGFREYDPERDAQAVHRIWRETGWQKEGEEEGQDLLLECGSALVADLRGEAECLVVTVPGDVRYLDVDLPLSVVAAVSTSRIARGQRLARRLTAAALMNAAENGAAVSALGMFEQGFYNTLGFGNGPYVTWVSFDPSHLVIDARPRPPRRLTAADWEAAHSSRLARRRLHGGCNLTPAAFTRSMMVNKKDAFGLGYYDGPDGELTHHVWINTEKPFNGPYSIWWTAWETPAQFTELMALLRGLGDQVRLVEMQEPEDIQLQDLLRQPLKHRKISAKSEFEAKSNAAAYWQMRILDLSACLAKTHLRWGEARFNLELRDPIEAFLENGGHWRGIGGEYVVTLGMESTAVSGKDASLPTLSASVGAFTRMWLGVRSPTGLAVTDELAGPPELLARLDQALRLPRPHPDWDF